MRYIGGKMEQKWVLTDENFGELLPYIKDKNITDIDFNGKDLWVTDLNKGRYKVELSLSENFVGTFTTGISNATNEPFNKAEPILEVQADGLRISITHEEFAKTGTSICIRKSLPEVRHTIESMLNTEYCGIEELSLLINCVKAKMNFALCGEPGIGKTEFLKFLCQFIPNNERIITIEDCQELHLRKIYPEKDVVELVVNKIIDYSGAIEHSLRMDTKWIILSETRGEEAKDLLKQWTTGLKGFTTLHVDDLGNLPDRYMNMIGKSKDADRLENSIYEYLNIGVKIQQREDEKGKRHRFIGQIAFYDRESNENKVHLIVDNGKIINRKLPKRIEKMLRREGIKDFFHCGETISFETIPIDLKLMKGA